MKYIQLLNSVIKTAVIESGNLVKMERLTTSIYVLLHKSIKWTEKGIRKYKHTRAK